VTEARRDLGMLGSSGADSEIVKSMETPRGAPYAPAVAVGGVFVATVALATALPFFLAAFLAADLVFRVRIAFFCIELRLEDIGIPFVGRFQSLPFVIGRSQCGFSGAGKYS
jgi:hypothetical protein